MSLLAKVSHQHTANDGAKVVATGNQTGFRARQKISFLERHENHVDDTIHHEALEEVEHALEHHVPTYSVEELQASVEKKIRSYCN